MKHAAKVEFFRGAKSWYWHVKAANSKLVAIGGEGFSSESKAREGFAIALRLMHAAAAEKGLAKDGKRQKPPDLQRGQTAVR